MKRQWILACSLCIGLLGSVSGEPVTERELFSPPGGFNPFMTPSEGSLYDEPITNELAPEPEEEQSPVEPHP